MEIEREVVGDFGSVEDLVEVRFVARTEEDVVVGDLGVAPLDPEVDDKERHAEALALEARGFALGVGVVAEQGVVGVDHIGVGGDGVEIAVPAVGGGHPGDPAVGGVDPFHRRVEPDLAAELLEELDQRRDQRAGAALDEEDPPVALEIVDQGVDRR